MLHFQTPVWDHLPHPLLNHSKDKLRKSGTE